MIRAALLLACALAAPAARAEAPIPAQPAPVVRQLVVQLDAAPAALAARLARALPQGTGPELAGDGAYELAVSGPALPAPLRRFLAESFGAGHGLAFNRLRTASLHLAPRAGGTELRVMTVAPATESGRAAAATFHARVAGAPLAPSAAIVMDGATGGGAGDLVLSVPGAPNATAARYAAALAALGRAVDAAPLDGGRLVFAENRSGAVAIFVQPDPDAAGRSLVVIRALEGE